MDLGILMAIGLLGAASPAQTKPSAAKPPPKDLAQLLRSKAETEWAAFLAKDKKALGDLLADDFIAVSIDREGTRNKQQAISSVEHSVVREYALSSFRMFPLGNEAALLTYEVYVTFPESAAVKGARLYIAEVWLNRDKQWRMLHYQETRVK